jgi:acetyl esterase/lipase
MEIERDIVYRELDGIESSQTSLDIYYDESRNILEKRPVVVFIHGGGWVGGDKASFNNLSEDGLPSRFVSNGYVFVSINFRLPTEEQAAGSGIQNMSEDIAKAIKWLSINIRRYGGHKDGFILLGYSSGAHLASLVATDRGYLKKVRMDVSDIHAVIAMDVAHYDVPTAIEALKYEDVGLNNQMKRVELLCKLMGKLPTTQSKWSPSSYIGPWLGNTRFLLLSAGLYYGSHQFFSSEMSERFMEKLRESEIRAEHHHFAFHEHTDFISHFSGEIEQVVMGFLAAP